MLATRHLPRRSCPIAAGGKLYGGEPARNGELCAAGRPRTTTGQRGFSLVEQDEHRHIAFGVRFLRDACTERPELRRVVERVVCDLVPKAVHVFVPPEADGDAADFTSYGYHSSQVYGYAYKALKRRMAAIGVEILGAEELMPGRVDLSGLQSQRLPLVA